MANVKTVLGEISGDELGIVDYHEHLYFDAPAWLLREDRDFTLNNVEKSADELRSWARAGGKTIIECSAIDFGRDIHAVRQIAELVPEVNVIALTGFNKPYYCDKSVFETSDEDHIRRCVRDITEGIDGTDYRAGIIKGGTGYNTMNDQDQKLMRIAAEVHLETGAPVLTHTEAGTMGLEQVEFLAEYGVESSRVVLSHMDRNPDFWVHKNVAQTGVFLGYDCPGKFKYGPDEIRVNLLKRMVEAGFGKNILLGNDLGRPSYWRSYGGGPGLDYVLTRYVARLKDEGISDESIEDLLVKNPRRWLAGEK